MVNAFTLHGANALNGLRGRTAELNQQQPKDRSCTTDATATRHRHGSPGSESVNNLAQERSEFGVVPWVRRTTITASLAAETASGSQKPAKSATLNARLAELDEALAAKRITRAEHKRLRARLLAQF